MFALRLGPNRVPLRRMGFELCFGFLGVPEHDQKTSFFWTGFGRSREASGPTVTRLGIPKIGPGRIILGIFGVRFGGLVF